MQPKVDIYQEVTDTIIAAIEEGNAEPGSLVMPWHKSTDDGLPRNVTTGNDYNGVNVLALWIAATRNVYRTNQWASYKQWKQAGAQVRKGEHGAIIVFTKPVVKKTGEFDRTTGEEKVDAYQVLKYSRVFNADQVDGYDVPEPPRPALAERTARAEEFVAYSRADVRHGGQSAYYAPELDYVQMPDMDLFRDTPTRSATEGYYAVMLHELTHWTRHQSRLDRDFGKRFKLDAYAMEELVAELGAAFLCAELGITAETAPDHSQYIATWLRAFKDDKRAIFTAASAATKAADHLRSLQPAVRQIAA